MGSPLFWIDAQLPPALATWINGAGGQAIHLLDLDLLRAGDPEIFTKARDAGAVIVTKDEDFVLLLESQGAPPQIVWITLGNVRNTVLCTRSGRVDGRRLKHRWSRVSPWLNSATCRSSENRRTHSLRRLTPT